MANLVITSTTNLIKVDFGVYASENKLPKKGVWHKGNVRFELKYSDTYIDVSVNGVPSFAVSFDGSTETLQVDTIGGVTPTDNSNLYDLLIALLG